MALSRARYILFGQCSDTDANNKLSFAVLVDCLTAFTALKRLSLLQGSSVALAQSVLAELPDQVASFFNSYNLKPPNVFSGSRPL